MDREYRTLPGAEHTAVMGSSLGGLCSLALAWDHPEIFGGAASLSGAFQVEQTNFLNEVLKNYHGTSQTVPRLSRFRARWISWAAMTAAR